VRGMRHRRSLRPRCVPAISLYDAHPGNAIACSHFVAATDAEQIAAISRSTVAVFKSQSPLRYLLILSRATPDARDNAARVKPDAAKAAMN
jgi:hypothetical protein